MARKQIDTVWKQYVTFECTRILECPYFSHGAFVLAAASPWRLFFYIVCFCSYIFWNVHPFNPMWGFDPFAIQMLHRATRNSLMPWGDRNGIPPVKNVQVENSHYNWFSNHCQELAPEMGYRHRESWCELVVNYWIKDGVHRAIFLFGNRNEIFHLHFVFQCWGQIIQVGPVPIGRG